MSNKVIRVKVSKLRSMVHEALTPMMDQDHITNEFAKMVRVAMWRRSFDTPWEEIAKELLDDGYEPDDVRNAVAAARTREEMGEDEWYEPEWSK